tara:strand:+ start:1568 stop:1942 length:375 start_codon:yes stop_codon:yes gene_type:complete
MANKNLDIKSVLTATDPINGILTLNDTENQTVVYNDAGVSSASISVASGAASQLIASSVAKLTYVWIKNTDVTNFLILKNDAGNIWGRLLPGEFNVFSVAPSVGFEVEADTAAVVAEYALFQAP